MTSTQTQPLPAQGSLPHQWSSLIWCLQRLAKHAGLVAIDRIQVHEVQQQLQSIHQPMDGLQHIIQGLGWPQPVRQTNIDAIDLPLLMHHPVHGWALVVAPQAQNTWCIQTPFGQHTIAYASLSEGVMDCWKLKLPNPQSHQKNGIKALIVHTLWQHKTLFLDGALATLLIQVLALASSFFSMQVYDRVIPTQSLDTLWALSLGVLLAIGFELLLKLVRSGVMEHAAMQMDAHLSRAIFERLLSIRLDQMPPSVGSLAAQLRAYEGIRTFLTASTAHVLVDMPMSLLLVCLLGALSTLWLMWVPMTFLSLSILMAWVLRRAIERSAMGSALDSHLKTGLLVEAVEGAETLRAGQGGWRFLSRWVNVTQSAMHHDLRMRQYSEMGGYVTSCFQQLSYVALVVGGSYAVMEGQMTMGALIACTTLSGRILAPIGMLPSLWVQWAHAKAAIAGLEKLYELETDTHTAQTLVPEQLQGHYKLSHVKFAYAPDAAALHLDELHIQAGDKVAVLGPVGSGKSTLLRLLSGLYPPQEGRITLDGIELSHIARPTLCEQIGYLQQDHRLFQGSLRDNLLIGLPDPGDAAILAAATQTGLLQLISEHPRGLDLPLSEGGKGLSGGQKQLVALTRLLLTQPQIWLLDEPTASMDDETERRCLATLKQQLTPQRTAIIVTHKPALLALATHMVVVSKHRIILSGRRDEVIQRINAQHSATTT